jgi:hypothetical protein
MSDRPRLTDEARAGNASAVTVVRLAEERPAYYGKAITDRLHRLTRIAICYAEGEIKETSNKAHFSPTARPSLGRPLTLERNST